MYKTEVTWRTSASLGEGQISYGREHGPVADNTRDGYVSLRGNVRRTQ